MSFERPKLDWPPANRQPTDELPMGDLSGLSGPTCSTRAPLAAGKLAHWLPTLSATEVAPLDGVVLVSLLAKSAMYAD